MTANNYNPFKPPETKAIMVMAWLFVLAVLAVLLGGCSTLHKTQSDSSRKVDSVVVSKYDSAALNKVIDGWSNTVAKITEYKPGRDSVIIVEGETRIIQVPPQVVRVIETQRTEGSKEQSQQVAVNRSDSAVITLLSQLVSKDKEKSGIPFWGWLAIGFALVFLIVMVAMVYLISKQGNKIASLVSTVRNL